MGGLRDKWFDSKCAVIFHRESALNPGDRREEKHGGIHKTIIIASHGIPCRADGLHGAGNRGISEITTLFIDERGSKT